MSKILGFTNNGGKDWFTSSQYGNREIHGIPDPEGGHTLNPPTSIPSPFARMDLVRKSFENIVESPDLRYHQHNNRVIASKDDEKSVSECLDLAEILFFYNNYKSKIEIIDWNRTTQIDNLKSSLEIGHKRLGEVLELFLNQDANSFNFDDVKCIYLIKYNHEVIGGTSPLTLFFSTAKDFSNLNLKSSKGTTFFKNIVPLYERDESFQKYLYLLFKNNSQLGNKMKAFDEYMSKSLKFLQINNATLFSDLNSLQSAEINNYIDLHTSNAGQVVESLGAVLKTIDPELVIRNIRKSEFIIHSAKSKEESKPLALQNNYNKALRYINGFWDARTQVPYKAPNSNRLERILPGQDIKYPYLTVSDFLEPDIIRLVYPINNDKYFDGNLKLKSAEETKSFLLPIKPLFFEYFNVEDLINGGTGKPQILIDETAVASAIRVQLKIPINSGKDQIVFERIYHNDGISDEESNKGTIKEHQFGLTLFPFLKHPEGITPYYNIQLIDRDVAGKFADAEYTLNFFNSSSNLPVDIEFETIRNKKQKGDVSKVGSKYFTLNKVFDYIQVDNNFSKGIIIPKWSTGSNTGNQFAFAIDFGTTNTHIEYSLNNSAPKSFEITKDERQAISLLNDSTDHNFSGTGAIDIRTIIQKEFIPELISRDTLYNFPHRTAISQSKSNAPMKGGIALNDFNIPFIFEKNLDKNSKFFTNLKWDSKELNNEFRVFAFLEQLILLIRNKVLINGGDLGDTKIIWTYPTSMSPFRKNNLQKTWNELFKKYFNSDDKPIDICESVAPYHYFQGNAQLEGLGYGVSVLMDIGGGTSDVVVYENNMPKLISSYKFAGNTLFGDGYKESGNITKNNLINRFKDDFDSLLNVSNPTLFSILDQLYNEQKSSDYNTFLFSLANNHEIRQKELFDYSKKISSELDLKIIFLYFYCAKVYHIAQLMKINNIELPLNLIFSGNGSKILNIITEDQRLISDITKEIFLKVYDLAKYRSEGLKINIERNFPKEVTCKGALMHHKLGVEDSDITQLKRIFTCAENGKIFNLTNAEVTDTIKNKVVLEVKKFNQLFISLNTIIDFQDHFGISPSSFDTFKELVNQHLGAYLQGGIDYNNRIDGASPTPNANISETMFFYPIVETIQQLIKELASVKQ